MLIPFNIPIYAEKMLDLAVNQIIGKSDLQEIPYFYKLTSLKFNDKLQKLINEWKIVSLLRGYFKLAKLMAPDSLIKVIRKMWECEKNQMAKLIVN